MTINPVQFILGLTAIVVVICGDGLDVRAGSASAFDPRAVLQKALGDALDFSVTRKRYRTSYCPDNTCSIIEMPQNVGRRVMADFTYLHTVFLNGYAMDPIPKFKKTQNPQHVQAILDQYAGVCDRRKNFERCVIETMIKTYEIDLAFSRYDEGATHETPVTPPRLEKLLARIVSFEKILEEY